MHPLDPIGFNQIAEVFGFVSSWIGMDKIQDMDFDVHQTLVIRSVEVSAYLTFQFVLTDVVEMGLESVHDAVFGFGHFTVNLLHSSHFKHIFAVYYSYTRGKLFIIHTLGGSCLLFIH